jgi:hypothetical protein
MRENRTSGSEGGGMKPINLPTPIQDRGGFLQEALKHIGHVGS